MSKKVKSNAGNVKLCTHCYNPVYVKYNFSYFECPKEFTKQMKAYFFDRMVRISSEPYNILLKWPKATGFEFEDVDIGREIPNEFKKRFEKKQYSKFTIMRLYPNNKPIMARIVGITINKIFYVFYIFIGEEGYKR